MHNFLHMTTYVLKLAKRGETAICFGQVKIALGPGTWGAVAAPVDKPWQASSCPAGAGTLCFTHTTLTVSRNECVSVSPNQLIFHI